MNFLNLHENKTDVISFVKRITLDSLALLMCFFITGVVFIKKGNFLRHQGSKEAAPQPKV